VKDGRPRRGRVAAPVKAVSAPRGRTLDGAKLAARDRLALRDFGDRLRTALGPDLVELRLFGAKARGEALDDAELDVAVSPRVLTPEKLTDPAWRRTGFVRGIERDGISFHPHVPV
jgi:hypothetical protein